MTTNIFDGTDWVHVADVGWLYRNGDGWFFSDRQQQWIYEPSLLTPEGILLDPPSIPLQARASHAVSTITERLTTGEVLPLATDEPDGPAAEVVHRHGWPTWKDAWGVKGDRPGGLGRAICRGYIRLWMYLVVPFGFLSLFMGGDSGVFGFGVVVFFALPMFLFFMPCLYVFRAHEFDPAKGAAAGAVWVAGVTYWAEKNKRRPMAAGYGGPYRGPQPPWT